MPDSTLELATIHPPKPIIPTEIKWASIRLPFALIARSREQSIVKPIKPPFRTAHGI
jgi:hypothetical protein